MLHATEKININKFNELLNLFFNNVTLVNSDSEKESLKKMIRVFLENSVIND